MLGVFPRARLVPVGRVGTGFPAAGPRLSPRLAPLEPQDGALRRQTLGRRRARCAPGSSPELVAEVEFRAWTADGHLRHAAFRGLREDKPAREIVRESRAVAGNPAPRRRSRLTHPDRVYWPEDGVTKQGLADYYAEVWPRMAPHLVNRPLALLRCPGGIDGQCFFQKHAWKGLSRRSCTFDDPQDESDEPLIAIDGLPG